MRCHEPSTHLDIGSADRWCRYNVQFQRPSSSGRTSFAGGPYLASCCTVGPRIPCPNPVTMPRSHFAYKHGKQGCRATLTPFYSLSWTDSRRLRRQYWPHARRNCSGITGSSGIHIRRPNRLVCEASRNSLQETFSHCDSSRI
jgi:hypothetical protein